MKKNDHTISRILLTKTTSKWFLDNTECTINEARQYLYNNLICSKCLKLVEHTQIDWAMHEIGKNNNKIIFSEYLCNHCKQSINTTRRNNENWKDKEYRNKMSDNKKKFWNDEKRINNIKQIKNTLKSHSEANSLHNFHNEISQKSVNDETYFYIAKIKNSNKLKFGITNNIRMRKLSNRYNGYDFEEVKKFKNRIYCAYAEYKCRILFGDNTEYINKNQKEDLINYVKNLKFTKNILKEIAELKSY